MLTNIVMYWYVSPSLRVYKIINSCGLSDSDVLVFRYSAVCRPHAYRDSNITERTGTRVAKYVTPVIIFSAIYNIPKFLEYKVSRNVRKCSINHSTVVALPRIPAVVSKQNIQFFLSVVQWSML